MSRLAAVSPPILVCCLGLSLLACERDTPRSSGPVAPSARAGSSSEDSSDTGGITTASLTATVSLTLTEETGFVVGVESTECAAGGNTIELTSPVSEVLTTDGCSLSAGTSWSFAGPHLAGTDVTFEFTSGFTAAKIRVDGSFPEWSLRFEDGTDDDFDDIVLTIRATEQCEIFEGPVSDPLLQRPAVQRILQKLAELSNFDSERVSRRLERGGYIVRRPDGSVEFVEHRYIDPVTLTRTEPQLCTTPYDPQLQREIRNAGGDILSQIHTHPIEKGTIQNPGNCTQYIQRPNGEWVAKTLSGQDLKFDAGPGYEDLRDFRNGTTPWPGMLLSPEKLYKWKRKGPMETGLEGGSPTSFDLADGENACIG